MRVCVYMAVKPYSLSYSMCTGNDTGSDSGSDTGSDAVGVTTFLGCLCVIVIGSGGVVWCSLTL